MEAILIRIGPRLKTEEAAASSQTLERRIRLINSEAFEFFCYWVGDPGVLKDLILSRVDWGPFDIQCEPGEESYDGHCRCEVQYYGPPGEKSYLMTSFWGLMESFPPFQSSTHCYANASHTV
jgi:hypothetical protein